MEEVKKQKPEGVGGRVKSSGTGTCSEKNRGITECAEEWSQGLPVYRNAKGQFAKGIKACGVLTSSPEIAKYKKEARNILKAATPEAARRLVELIHHKNPAIAIRAAETILDRILGKAKETMDVEISNRETIGAQIKAILLENVANNPKPIEALPVIEAETSEDGKPS